MTQDYNRNGFVTCTRCGSPASYEFLRGQVLAVARQMAENDKKQAKTAAAVIAEEEHRMAPEIHVAAFAQRVRRRLAEMEGAAT